VDRVAWFLFQGKQGYCEYYASSMVIMLRHLGIPARLAGGYAPGSLDPKTRQIVVRESSAHAWPEVYFPNYGWIEFEPTPSQPVITHQETPTPTTAEPTVELTPGPHGSPTPLDDKDHQVPVPPGGAGTTSGGFTLPFGPVGGGLLIAGVAAALLALLLFLPFSPVRRRRQQGSAKFYYARMLFWSKLLRAGPAPYQTPYEYSEALSREVQGTGLYARTIARAYVRERFGRERRTR